MQVTDAASLADWQIDFEWLRVQHQCKDRFGRTDLPDMKSILFLLGLQEIGRWSDELTKEEKQDVIHVGTCAALSMMDYYAFEAFDADGWPHYKLTRMVDESQLAQQEDLLKRGVIAYFHEKIYDHDEEE